MLAKAFLVGALVLVGVQAQFFRDLGLSSFNWRSPFGPNEFWPDLRASASEVETVTVRDREPLAPDYKDPAGSPTDDKPVIQLKPTTTTTTTSKPSTPFSPVLPGGVIDVDTTGFGAFPSGAGFPSAPSFPEIPSNFGFGFRPGGLFGLGGFFGSVGELQPWWKGPNVCKEREESTDDEEESPEAQKNETESIPNMFSTAVSLSNCKQSANKYECITKVNNHGVVKTFTVRYKCCYGYQRTPDSNGCTKQVDLKPLVQTIEDVGCKEFRNMIKNNALEEKLDGNYTVFVPTDIALNEFTEKMIDMNKVEAVRRRRDIKNAVSSRDLLLNHVTPGFVDLAELGNEQIIRSENHNSSLRVNIYPTSHSERMVTVNCARISKPDNLAKNGIVHVVEGVVAPAAQSIRELLSESSRLSNLRKVLEATDLLKTFEDNGHYTIFAPTDEAFGKLDESTKQKLLRGDACANSIFKHLIVEHTICSSAIVGNATTHNIDGELIDLSRTTDDQLLIDGKAKITDADIIATNGVIHLIDNIVIPESAQHINQALKTQNFTKFENLIQQAGMGDEIDSLLNSTVFAPSDEAFETPEGKKALEEIKDDPARLKEVVMYHTVKGLMQSCEMNNNAILKSNLNEMPLRLNLYSTLPVFTNVINRATINCARVTGFDEKACGSVIHEINKILVPPKKTILDVVNTSDKFTTLSKIIAGTEVENVLKQENQSISLLAPTDEAFASLAEEDLKTLTDDKNKANQVLKNHILTEVLCCSGVGPQTWGFNTLVPTLTGQNHQIGRTGKHQIRIGKATITSCDNLATNGVIHTINKVLLPQRHQAPSFGMFMFDI